MVRRPLLALRIGDAFRQVQIGRYRPAQWDTDLDAQRGLKLRRQRAVRHRHARADPGGGAKGHALAVHDGAANREDHSGLNADTHGCAVLTRAILGLAIAAGYRDFEPGAAIRMRLIGRGALYLIGRVRSLSLPAISGWVRL